MRILLVEDHADTAHVFGRILESVGHVVLAAEDCRRAREAARECAFDLLICDLALPDGDGRHLLPELRKISGRIPALCFSAYVNADDRESARLSGFDAFLAKPTEFDELLRVIQRITALGV